MNPFADSSEKNSLKTGVIGYGSLLNPNEIRRILDGSPEELIPVRVHGYSRIFNNEATWRPREGSHRAVLNVEQDANAHINATIFKLANEEEWNLYLTREEGYDFEPVNKDRIETYRKDDEKVDNLDVIYIPVGNRTSKEICPIQSYLQTCLDGADYWDSTIESFLEEFISTTKMADGTSLEEYLSSEE